MSNVEHDGAPGELIDPGEQELTRLWLEVLEAGKGGDPDARETLYGQAEMIFREKRRSEISPILESARQRANEILKMRNVQPEDILRRPEDLNV